MAKKFSGSQIGTKKSSTKKSFKTSTENSSVSFYSYSDITLRLYVDIAASKDYRRLIINGDASDDECFEAWERIVKRNTEVNGSFDFDVYFNNTQRYAQLICDYNVIKAYLLKLAFVVDDEAIDYLKTRGYKINVASNSKKLYAESINACLRRSDNIMTKILRARNELLAMEQSEKKDGAEDDGIEIALAHLSAIIGYEIKDDITLARFNEYRKIAKRKSEGNRKRAQYPQ